MRNWRAIGAMVVEEALTVAACDNNPDDNVGTTPAGVSTTTTGG